MSHGSGNNRLMSIHSMLGSMGNGPNTSTDSLSAKRAHDDYSTTDSTLINHNKPHSPRQQDHQSHKSIFRTSSQNPLSNHAHDPARFFAPPQAQEPQYNSNTLQSYSTHQHNQGRLSSIGNGLHHHPQPAAFAGHDTSNHQHLPYAISAIHERERDRDREIEAQRRERERERERELERDEREKAKERDLQKERLRAREQDRERERQESNRTPIDRLDTARSNSSFHMPTVPHHHHHVHHNHAPPRKPKLTIISAKVFEEARTFTETKLGRWTYDPTSNIPFKLRVNSTFVVHIPRRFLHPENNSALRRRKVWGTEIYTDDSDLAAILIHSTSRMPTTGDLEMKIRVMPRLLKYKSSMTNDLRSRGWNTTHDGLSLYCEQVVPVFWTKERQGKGFAKRSIEEMHSLSKEMAAMPVQSVIWPARKYRKFGHLDDEAEQTREFQEMKIEPVSPVHVGIHGTHGIDEMEGDETIELSMEENNTDIESSFVEPPQGSLIANVPDILPTELSSQGIVRQEENNSPDDLGQAVAAFPRETSAIPSADRNSNPPFPNDRSNPQDTKKIPFEAPVRVQTDLPEPANDRDLADLHKNSSATTLQVVDQAPMQDTVQIPAGQL